jgi:putative membrane protein
VSEHVLQGRRLHPATLIVRWLRIVPQMFAAGVGLAATARREGFGRFLIYAAVAAALGAVFAFLYWWRFRYTIGDGEIVIEKGVLRRQRRVIPFDRVHDIAIEQRLLARLFGAAKVRIETGGAARDEGDLDMIAIADAHALRDIIRHGARAPHADAPAETPEEPVLFEMGLARVLFSGVFGFSLLFLAAIWAVVQQLEQLHLVDPAAWFTPQEAETAAHLVTLTFGLELAALVIVLGVVAGVVRTVLRDFGFTLTRSEAGLRRRRGLFTLSEVVIPIRRTQVALIESGLIGRALGWQRLAFQTLGADKKEGGVQVAAPFARMEEILPILAEAGFPPPPPRESFHGAPKRALLRKIVPHILIAVPLTMAAFLFDVRAGVGVAAIAVLAVAAALRWRTHGHYEHESAFCVTGGLLRRRLWLMPYEKLQAIDISSGPIQRPMRLATLVVDTAGAPSMHSLAMHDLDAAEADALADRLYAAWLGARALIKGRHG